MIPYIVSRDGTLKTMTLFLSGVPRTIDSSHPNFKEILDNVSTLTVPEARKLLDLEFTMKRSLARFGNIVVENGTVTYKGEVVHGLLADRMIQMLEEGTDIKAWALFMENLQQNPAKHAVDELYLWLERSGMPITERGNFLAYKKVKDDYTSYHTNADGSKFFNNVGTLCSMPRNKVDDNRNQTCSTGLHFCSWDYLPHYMGNQGKVLLVEVNPAHVVSIPSDYNNAKGRAEAYLVVGELPEKEAEHAFKVPFVSYYDSDYITWEQTDEIDYSGIDENWYEDYEDEDDEWYTDSYQVGVEEGSRDVYAFKPYQAEDAFYDCSADFRLDEESFLDGYADGFYQTTDYLQNVVEEEIGEINLDESEPEEWFDTPDQAAARGFLCGLNSSLFELSIAADADGTEFFNNFEKGYLLGYNNK